MADESGGRIAFELYPAMQLGGAPPELFDQAKDGVVDIIWTVLGYTPGRFPKSEVFELPFMIHNGEQGSAAFYNYVMANAADEFAGVVREAGAPVICETPGGAAEHLADFAWLRERL